ncbi:MAG: glycosyltransferase family 2 protein [Clostridia bacterium]|nr:glycosyltransferase family 2 protein [Clostridia bacterium]
MKLSILTATYNRANYLPKLYESIKENLKYNVTPEWIIVDDGSTDDTKNIVQSFIDENKVIIKYLYQKNSGKMSAINEAVKMATGDLIVDCDSDDYFTNNSFEIIEKNSEKLLQNQELYGLVFLKSEENGKISGKEFSQKEHITSMFDLYFKEDIGGEKIIVYNSKIRKQYSHQLEHNEKFITEARMYHKMDEKYKLLAINEVIEQGNYIEDGYTKNINKTFKESPYGYYIYFKELLQKDMRGVMFSKRLYAIKHYILFSYLTKNKFNANLIKDRLNRFLYIILYLPGRMKSRKF